MAGNQAKPITLFYSYSHKDEDLRLKLETHLAALRRGGLIAEWHDRKLEPGDAWKDEIDRHLTSADIVLLLVSSDFIASDYCWGEEMTKALARHARGEARVIPIILRHCRWQRTPLARLQAIPKEARPIRSWPDEDEAFNDVVASIERAVEAVRRQAEEALRRRPEAQQPRETAAVVETSRPTAKVREEDKVISPAQGLLLEVAPGEPARGGASGWHHGKVFRDIEAPWCPELVVIRAGSFLMGSPDTEEERSRDEGPQHQVRFAQPFALGRYPVTFEEYDHFCAETKRKTPPDQGWGRGRRPVINVSWEAAKAYVAWLSEATGARYRLPSEAEWEYACRTGTATPFWTGATIGTEQANYDGNYTYGPGGKGEYRGRTTPVDTFEANPWGLHDMHGNVSEWCEDCWNDSYAGAPADGSAWSSGDCGRRALRGGSWFGHPRFLRSANRIGDLTVHRSDLIGFRVARALDP